MSARLEELLERIQELQSKVQVLKEENKTSKNEEAELSKLLIEFTRLKNNTVLCD